MMIQNKSAERSSPEAERLFSPLLMAFFLVLYVFLPSFILSVFLLLRVGSPTVAYGCSHAVLLALAFYLRQRISMEINWTTVLVFAGLLVIAHAVSWYFFDFFHDGLAYFQPAISQIAGGFNPVYDGYMDFGRGPDIWSDVATYYPKSTMYFAACLTAALGDVQFGKVSHILLFAATLFYAAETTRGESLLKKCVWYLACLNPIILNQWTSLIVDGDLASLCLIGLLFANSFFKGKMISGVEYALGIMALALLFGVKTTGFPYGSIIIFFICVNRLWTEYAKRPDERAGPRFFRALGNAFRPGLRLGGMVLLVSCVLNFHPYITNLREGKNIFYPAVQSFQTNQPSYLDQIGDAVYPTRHDRFTRLLFSIFASPMSTLSPAWIRSPLSSPAPDWRHFENSYNIYAGGLGPWFGLLLCAAILLQVLLKGPGNLWLLLTLLLMTFIQPHAWVLRYSPFVWLFPFVCLDSVPEKKKVFIALPLLLAAFNAGGIAFFSGRYQWYFNLWLRDFFEPCRGKIVFMDQSIFDFDSIFKRFSVTPEYVNPEEVVFHRNPGFGRLAQDRDAKGVNIFLAEDLLPPPEFSMNLSDEAALPWLYMSEGLVPSEEYQEGRRVRIWRSYSNRVKFFMSFDRKPENDWLLTLKGKLYTNYALISNLSVVPFVNDQAIGVWKIDRTGNEQTFVVPRKLLEKAFNEEGHLLKLMLRMPAVSSVSLSQWKTSDFGLELESLELRPKIGDDDADSK
ncbi:MAG: hypothetical protein LBR61_07715 [Synergistaceae bacterium]|jgi:hypothetical protein|nr:hypothetical protein [Synergistaceae bacterium]